MSGSPLSTAINRGVLFHLFKISSLAPGLRSLPQEISITPRWPTWMVLTCHFAVLAFAKMATSTRSDNQAKWVAVYSLMAATVVSSTSSSPGDLLVLTFANGLLQQNIPPILFIDCIASITCRTATCSIVKEGCNSSEAMPERSEFGRIEHSIDIVPVQLL